MIGFQGLRDIMTESLKDEKMLVMLPVMVKDQIIGRQLDKYSVLAVLIDHFAYHISLSEEASK